MANARSVNVKRVDLLAKLKENREKHAADFKVAFEGYQIELVKVLEAALAKAKAKDPEYNLEMVITEMGPENHTGEYDKVIAMMEMSVDDVINLDASSFQQFVLDDWAWKQNFTATATKYMSNVRQ